MEWFMRLFYHNILRHEAKQRIRIREKQAEDVKRTIRKIFKRIHSEHEAKYLLENLRELRNELLRCLLHCEVSFCTGHLLPLVFCNLSHPSVAVRIEILKIVQVLFQTTIFVQKLPMNFRQILAAFLFGHLTSLDSTQEKDELSQTLRLLMKNSPPSDQLVYLTGAVIFPKLEDQGDEQYSVMKPNQVLRAMNQFANKKGQEYQELVNDPKKMMEFKLSEEMVPQSQSGEVTEKVKKSGRRKIRWRSIARHFHSSCSLRVQPEPMMPL